jgi:hypothetical protein
VGAGLCAGAAFWNAGALGQTQTIGWRTVGGGQVCQGNCRTPAPYCPSAPHVAPYGQPAPMAPSPLGEEAAPEGVPPPGAMTAPDLGTTPPADFSSLSSATGTASAPSSASPVMVGDFFGSTQQASILVQGAFSAFNGQFIRVLEPTESVVGRVKQAESYSPLPADRVFLDYATYHNVPIGTSAAGAPVDIDLQRFTPGVERTFLDQMMSVELRMPVALTQNSTYIFGQASDADHWEAGNLNLAIKTLLVQTDRMALTGGLGIRTPTANDLEFRDPNTDTTVSVENHAVHLLPYFGVLAFPNDVFFGQAMIQVDVDANGNPILINDQFQGRLQDQTLLYSSFMLGSWLYDNPASDSLQTVALTTELHHSTTISDADNLVGDNIVVFEGDAATGQADNDFDAFTGVLGLHFFYAGGARVTFAYGVPFGHDRFADGEFRTLLNRYY